MCNGKHKTDGDLTRAAFELEELRQRERDEDSDKGHVAQHARFPLHCMRYLYGIEGNLRCIDCDATNPQWATLSYGALLCIECSGRHRQMGVQVSVVRSITMDSWKHSDVLAMLEGGNKQLGDFFARHGLSEDDSKDKVLANRYKTNAAKFYKKNLSIHVSRVSDAGLYMGREMSRQPQKRRKNISIKSNQKEKECALACETLRQKSAKGTTRSVEAEA